MKPTIGRIVQYVLNHRDAGAINQRRVPDVGHSAGWPAGAQAHVGNFVNPGDWFPLLITRVDDPEPDTINGQVILDGSDTLWVTSIHEGLEAGTWRWPGRVPESRDEQTEGSTGPQPQGGPVTERPPEDPASRAGL